MKRKLLLLLMVLLPMAVLITVTSCSKDDEIVQPPINNNGSGNDDSDDRDITVLPYEEIIVTVDVNGKADGNHVFSRIDETNFLIDGLKYRYEQESGQGYLVVTSYDPALFSGVAKIISKLIYGGQSLSVDAVNSYAFHDCKALTSVIIPDMKSIGSRAFEGCTGLTSIAIGRVSSIDNYAFSDCTGLTSVNITDLAAWCQCHNYSNPLSYAHNLYLNGNRVKNLVIPEGVIRIGISTFSGCNNLTSVTIPNSVTSIGDHAFYGCNGLTSIKVAEGNPNYDSRDNSNAIIVTATNTLVVGCKNTIIPNSVTSIGSSAFYGCSGLTSITIPNNVTSIGWDAFHGCSNLTSVTLESNSIVSASRYTYNSMNSIFGEQVRTYTIGNGVTSIGAYAFYGCSSLASITISNSVTSIGSEAFRGCYFIKDKFINNTTLSDNNNWGATLCDKETGEGLLIKDNTVFRCRPWATTVTVPNSVTSIGSDAFRGCSSLLSVTIGNSVTSIGSYSFYDCSSLASVTIGNCVTSIGWYAFNGCNNLTTVTVKATTPPTIFDYDTFSNQSNATLYVPVGCKAAYQAAPYWKHFKVIIEN